MDLDIFPGGEGVDPNPKTFEALLVVSFAITHNASKLFFEAIFCLNYVQFLHKQLFPVEAICFTIPKEDI